MFILFIYLCQVQGIGPTFKLTVNLQNTSLSQPSTSLLITFLYDEKLYNFKKSFIEVYRYISLFRINSEIDTIDCFLKSF